MTSLSIWFASLAKILLPRCLACWLLVVNKLAWLSSTANLFLRLHWMWPIHVMKRLMPLAHLLGSSLHTWVQDGIWEAHLYHHLWQSWPHKLRRKMLWHGHPTSTLRSLHHWTLPTLLIALMISLLHVLSWPLLHLHSIIPSAQTKMDFYHLSWTQARRTAFYHWGGWLMNKPVLARKFIFTSRVAARFAHYFMTTSFTVQLSLVLWSP